MNLRNHLLSSFAVLALLGASGANANPVTRAFACTGAACEPARIPDSNGTVDGVVTFSIPTPATVCPGTTVTYGAHLFVQHANVGDLRIALISPGFARVNVLDRPAESGGVAGSCNGDDVHANFTDAGSAPQCADVIPSVGGAAHSAAQLSVFGSSWIPGTWQIEVRDMSPGGDGVVQNASLLAICGYTDAIFNDGFDLP